MTGPRKKPSRSPLRLLTLLVVVTGLALAGLYLARPGPVAVDLWIVGRGRVESTVANTRAGTVKALRRARLAPAAGGQVARLAIREGDRVESGGTLLELWNHDILAQLKLAESQTRAAEARAEEVCLKAAQARREATRQQRLSQEGIASVELVEKTISEAEAAEAACQAFRAAAQESAAGVEVARAALEKTILRAPFEGVVATLNVELGEYVTPSPPGIPTLPAVDLIETGRLHVKAPIDEVDAPRVRTGQSVRVTLDAFAGQSFEGRVSRVAPYVLDVEKQARTVDVEVELITVLGEAGEAAMLPGYSADVEILLEAREDVLRVPTEAILEADHILLLDDGVLVEREIRTGISNWDFTEVLSGLSAGERIVLSLDRENVRPGAPAVAGEVRETRPGR